MKLIDSPLTRELDRQGRRRDWLAERLGVKPWTLSKIEAGTQSAPSWWYPKAAAELGVTVDAILPQKEEAVA